MSPGRKYMTNCLWLLVFFASSGDVHGAKRKIPDYVIKCSRSAPAKFGDACINGNIEVFRPKFAQGIPEFNLPPMDPFFVESITFASSNFRAEFFNSTVIGSTDFDLFNGTFDYQTLTMSVRARFNSMHIVGSYHVSGRMLMLQLENQGRALFNASNVEASAEMHAKIREKHGKKFIDFSDRSRQKIQITFNEKPTLYFENLFPANEELTRTTNTVVNDNILAIFTDMMPIIDEVMGTFVFNTAQSIFSLFSVDELILP